MYDFPQIVQQFQAQIEKTQQKINQLKNTRQQPFNNQQSLSFVRRPTNYSSVFQTPFKAPPPQAPQSFRSPPAQANSNPIRNNSRVVPSSNYQTVDVGNSNNRVSSHRNHRIHTDPQVYRKQPRQLNQQQFYFPNQQNHMSHSNANPRHLPSPFTLKYPVNPSVTPVPYLPPISINQVPKPSKPVAYFEKDLIREFDRQVEFKRLRQQQQKLKERLTDFTLLVQPPAYEMGTQHFKKMRMVYERKKREDRQNQEAYWRFMDMEKARAEARRAELRNRSQPPIAKYSMPNISYTKPTPRTQSTHNTVYQDISEVESKEQEYRPDEQQQDTIQEEDEEQSAGQQQQFYQPVAQNPQKSTQRHSKGPQAAESFEGIDQYLKFLKHKKIKISGGKSQAHRRNKTEGLKQSVRHQRPHYEKEDSQAFQNEASSSKNSDRLNEISLKLVNLQKQLRSRNRQILQQSLLRSHTTSPASEQRRRFRTED